MPILTCAYPAMNSTFNVSASTKQAILVEFEKGLKITEALLTKKENLNWKRLFKKFNFFSAYYHFIMVSILSVDADHHNKWFGFAESKLRHLITFLQQLKEVRSGIVLEFRPWSTAYRIESTMNRTSANRPQYGVSETYFIGIRVKKNENIESLRVDLTQSISKFYSKFSGTITEEMAEIVNSKQVDLQINYVTRENLPEEVKPKAKNGTVLGRRPRQPEDTSERAEKEVV